MSTVPEPGSGIRLTRLTGQLRQGDGMALLAVFLWGLNIPLSKVSLGEMDLLVFSGVRTWLGAVVALTALVLLERNVTLRPPDRVPVVALGLFGVGLTQILFFAGLQLTLASHASLLQGLNPVFAAILAGWVGYGRLKPAGWVGVAVCLVGLWILTGVGWGTLNQRLLLGDALALLSGATGASYVVLSRRFLTTYSPLKIQAYALTSSALVVSVVAIGPWMRQDWSAISWPAYAALAYSGIAATVLAMLFWLSSVRRIGPIRTSIYQYLLPVVGLLFSLVLLGEGLDVRQSIGGAVLLGGLILALYA